MKKFLSLYATNIFGVVNDNMLKTLVCFVAVYWVGPEYKSLVVNATAGALVLPYLLFSPLAGKLPQLYSKQRIIRVAKLSELPIMLMAIAGFYLENIWITIGSVLLMGLQSALYSPSKYGLIKDIGGISGISKGMGGMEAIAFMGMLLGTVAGSFLAEDATKEVYSAIFLLLATMGIMCSLTIRAREERPTISTSTNPITFLRQTAHIVKQHRGLPHVIHLLSLFWWLSAALQVALILYCTDDLHMSPSQTGYLMALTAIGITAGCLVGGILDAKHYMITFTPLMGIVEAILLTIVFAVPLSPIPFAVCIALIAFVGGIFKIPLDAEIQKRVSANELNIVLAFFNLVSFTYIFLASATNILVTTFLPNRYIFLTLAIVIGVSSVIFIFDYKSVLCYIGRANIRLHYDINTHGRSTLNTTQEQNMLILPQHSAVIDPLILFAELYDVRMQPLVDDVYFRIPVIRHVLSLFDAVEVPDLRRSRRGVEKVRLLDDIICTRLAHGDNVLFYPTGHITTNGLESIGSRHLAYNTCKSLPKNTKVIGVRINGLWGSQWSRYGRTETPSIVKLLLKSFVLIFSGAILLQKKRKVDIQYVDITEHVKQWSQLSKMDFNKKLETWYNNDDIYK